MAAKLNPLPLVVLAVVMAVTGSIDAAMTDCLIGADQCKGASSVVVNGDEVQCCIKGMSMQSTSNSVRGRTYQSCRCYEYSSPAASIASPPMSDTNRVALDTTMREVQSLVDRFINMSSVWRNVGRMWSNWMMPPSASTTGNAFDSWGNWWRNRVNNRRGMGNTGRVATTANGNRQRELIPMKQRHADSSRQKQPKVATKASDMSKQ